MSAEAVAGQVVLRGREPLWFLGTLARLKWDGEQTGGRFAPWEGVLPHGAAPPLHSHPQGETFYVLEGEVTAWIVDLIDEDHGRYDLTQQGRRRLATRAGAIQIAVAATTPAQLSSSP